MLISLGLQFLQSLISTTEEATSGSFSELNACLIEVNNLEHISSLAATLMLVYSLSLDVRFLQSLCAHFQDCAC